MIFSVLAPGKYFYHFLPIFYHFLPFFALNSITLVPTASWSECVTADTGEVTKEAFLARFHTSLEKLDEDWNATVSLEPAVQRRAAAAISAG